MAQKTLTILQNPKTGYTYYTKRQKKGDKAEKKLSLKKYDPIAKAHVEFVEVKGSKPKPKKVEKKQQAKKKK